MSAMRLLPIEQRDRRIAELVATTAYVDPTTGPLYDPDELPVVEDPGGDEDADVPQSGGD